MVTVELKMVAKPNLTGGNRRKEKTAYNRSLNYKEHFFWTSTRECTNFAGTIVAFFCLVKTDKIFKELYSCRNKGKENRN